MKKAAVGPPFSYPAVGNAHAGVVPLSPGDGFASIPNL